MTSGDTANTDVLNPPSFGSPLDDPIGPYTGTNRKNPHSQFFPARLAPYLLCCRPFDPVEIFWDFPKFMKEEGIFQ